jgi:BirA family biotin operon repressor/biotin-[acetyl-CoA-carboxylase] ligase
MSLTSASEGGDHEDQVVFSSKDLQVFHLKRTVDSTQEEAKRLLGAHRRRNTTTDQSSRVLAVIADDQRKGRGTGGRSWVASKGNLYLTCAVAMDLIPMSKVPLLPLGVGTLVAERLAQYSKTRPTVKWPNDVLLGDGLKVAGTLIENYRIDDQDWWLVGIGVNVDSYPLQLPTGQGDFHPKPRSATCLQAYAKNLDSPKAVDLGVDLASGLQRWTNLVQMEEASAIVARWKTWANMGTYTIRETGEDVVAVDIRPDGQLIVIGQDGKERLLVADYFY